MSYIQTLFDYTTFLEIRKFARIFHTASAEVNDNWPKAVIKMYGFSRELISLGFQ
jgi:hypothetical protein